MFNLMSSSQVLYCVTYYMILFQKDILSSFTKKKDTLSSKLGKVHSSLKRKKKAIKNEQDELILQNKNKLNLALFIIISWLKDMDC